MNLATHYRKNVNPKPITMEPTTTYAFTLDELREYLKKDTASMIDKIQHINTGTEIGRKEFNRQKKLIKRNRELLDAATAVSSIEFLEKQRELCLTKLNRITDEFDAYMLANFPNLSRDTRQWGSLWKDFKKKSRHSIIWKQLTNSNLLLKGLTHKHI